MATVLFCSACSDTERVQSSSGRRKVKNSYVDGILDVYKLLESVIANKIEARSIQVDLGQLMSHATYMCKMCYYAYEKYIRSLEVLKNYCINC